MTGRQVVVVADLVIDRFLIGRPRRISREAPVLILEQQEERIVPGGGANAAANIAALGGRPLVAGVVGDDDHGGRLLAVLESQGIATAGVLRKPGVQTPTKTRVLAGSPTTHPQQVVRIDSGSGSTPTEAELDGIQERLRDSVNGRGGPVVAVLSDYGYGAVPPEWCQRLRSVLGLNAQLLVDSRYRLGEFRDLDGATPNQEEAEALAGHSLDDEAALLATGPRLLERLGVAFLLVTRGRRGMVLFQKRRPTLVIPIHGTDQVADVTGAGDTVIGALALALAAGASAVEAAILATYAGGVVVMKSGTATLGTAELRSAIERDPGLLERLRWAGC